MNIDILIKDGIIEASIKDRTEKSVCVCVGLAVGGGVVGLSFCF